MNTILHFRSAPLKNMLLHYDVINRVIEEFDVSEFPLKATGHIIPVLQIPFKAFVSKHGNKKLLFVLHHLDHSKKGEEFCLRCLNYENGQEFWSMNEKSRPSSISPHLICTNQNGLLFIADARENKVLVLKNNLELQPLISAPGSLGAMGWCYKSNRLLVLYRNIDRQFTTTAFSIGEHV